MRQLIMIASAFVISACGQAQNGEAALRVDAPKALGEIAKAEPALTAPTDKQSEVFGALADYVGMSFKGAPTGDSTETFTDIQKWEWALGGKAILIKHALEDGSYGGDTYVYPDAKTGKLTYVYVTNAGFHTVGEMIPTDDGGWIAEEAVEGHETITRVRSTSIVREDGTSSMTSEYLTGGKWEPGHGFEYAPTDDPLPKLKAAE